MSISVSEINDLQALEISESFESVQAISALKQLKWLSNEKKLVKILALIRLELNDCDSLADSTRAYKLELIADLEGQGMRLEDGSLSNSFICWYEEYCKLDVLLGKRQYSPQAIERGDHEPYWSQINSQEQSAVPIHKGGIPDREMNHVKAVVGPYRTHR